VRRPLRLLGLFVVLAGCLPVSAGADPFPVTSTADAGSGSLRAAIVAAEAHAGFDTIPIEVSGTIGLETGLHELNGELSITGPGAGELTVRREAAPLFRIFTLGPAAKVNLSGLTISNGAEERGGGIFSDGILTLNRVAVIGNEATASGSPTQGASAAGGGIYNRNGTLTLHESVVRDNRAMAESVVDYAFSDGGGIFSFGLMTVDRSTIAGNVAESQASPAGWAAADGGGLKVLDAQIEIERSTISGNSAIAEGGEEQTARGGGIQGGSFTMTSSTLTGNAAVAAETALGANVESFGTTSIRNTIVAVPQGDADSCARPEGSAGFNLDEDGSCHFEAPTDLTAIVPGLDPVLRMNGGATPTHALLPGGAAVDRGNAFGSNIDQRGSDRPSDFPEVSDSEEGDGSDIGAFELRYSPPLSAPVRVVAVPADRTPPNTRIVRAPVRITFDRIAKFRFASTEPQSRFQCKIDGEKWRGCATPYKRKVSRGAKHLFKVRAIDRFGNVDPSPARFGWRVKPLGG
jgi:hypothetical protein